MYRHGMSCAYMHVGGGHNLPFLFTSPNIDFIVLALRKRRKKWEVNLWLHMSSNNMSIYANMNNLISFRLCRFSRKKCCRGKFSEKCFVECLTSMWTDGSSFEWSFQVLWISICNKRCSTFWTMDGLSNNLTLWKNGKKA